MTKVGVIMVDHFVVGDIVVGEEEANELAALIPPGMWGKEGIGPGSHGSDGSAHPQHHRRWSRHRAPHHQPSEHRTHPHHWHRHRQSDMPAVPRRRHQPEEDQPHPRHRMHPKLEPVAPDEHDDQPRLPSPHDEHDDAPRHTPEEQAAAQAKRDEDENRRVEEGGRDAEVARTSPEAEPHHKAPSLMAVDRERHRRIAATAIVNRFYRDVMTRTSMSPQQVEAVRRGVSDIESGGNYTLDDQGQRARSNFGRFQYNMEDIVEIARDVYDEHAPSKQALLSSPDLQEKYYAGYLSLMHNRIMGSRYRDEYERASPEDKARILAMSQLGWANAMRAYVGGGLVSDSNRTRIDRWANQVNRYLPGGDRAVTELERGNERSRRMQSAVQTRAYSTELPPSSRIALEVPLTHQGETGGRPNVERIHPDLIRRTNAAYQAALAEGASFSITSGYRPATREQARALGMPESSSQEDVYERSFEGTNRQQWAAAPPGRSHHQLGLALDVADPTGWLHRNAARFGLQFPYLHARRPDYPHMEMIGRPPPVNEGDIDRGTRTPTETSMQNDLDSAQRRIENNGQ